MADQGSRRQLALVRWLYVAVYGSYGTTAVYRSLFYRRVGLGSAEIGLLLAVQPLVQLVAGPIWSAVGDRLGLRSRMLTIVTALSCLPMLAMIWWHSFPALIALSAAYAVFLGPIQPLTDSIALRVLGRERHRYASIRAFGSLGYAPVMWAFGYIIQRFDIRTIFVGYTVLMGAASLLSLKVEAQGPALRGSIAGGLRTLAQNRGWRRFMVALFVAMGAQAVTFGYTGLYLDTLGASEPLIGLSGAVGSASQTLLMLSLLPHILRRWGSRNLLLLSLCLYGLRFALQAVAPLPWVVVASQLLLGLSFGAALVAAVDYADRHAPKGMAATSQALATSFVSGLGRAAGGAFAGGMYDAIGPRVTFGVMSLVSLVAASSYRVLGYDRERARSAVGGDKKSPVKP